MGPHRSTLFLAATGTLRPWTEQPERTHRLELLAYVPWAQESDGALEVAFLWQQASTSLKESEG